ncbi:hypothetical protein PWT90_11038 [Aphanocladium album]|nr:hypothetical protein PWT90_11038 [Aphanocladium album]
MISWDVLPHPCLALPDVTYVAAMHGMLAGLEQQPGYRLLLNATSLHSIFAHPLACQYVISGTASSYGFDGTLQVERTQRMTLRDSVNHLPLRASSCASDVKPPAGPSGAIFLQFATVKAIASSNPAIASPPVESNDLLAWSLADQGGRGSSMVDKARLPEPGQALGTEHRVREGAVL